MFAASVLPIAAAENESPVYDEEKAGSFFCVFPWEQYNMIMESLRIFHSLFGEELSSAEMFLLKERHQHVGRQVHPCTCLTMRPISQPGRRADWTPGAGDQDL